MAALVSDVRLLSRFRIIAQVAALLTVSSGAVVLLGWALDVSFLKSISPKWVSMKANTALGMALSGIALWLLRRESPPPPRTRLIARGCAAVVALIGLLTLLEYGLRISFGIAFENVSARKRMEKELVRSNAEVERFNKIALGREERVIELKREVNRLCGRLGEPPQFDLSYAKSSGQQNV